MEFKGQRAVYITEDVSPFYAKAAKLIFNDLGIDFEKAVIDYADDECISLNLDGEDKILYYEQTDEGFAYELVDTDEYDDLTTTYAGYEEDDEEEDKKMLQEPMTEHELEMWYDLMPEARNSQEKPQKQTGPLG